MATQNQVSPRRIWLRPNWMLWRKLEVNTESRFWGLTCEHRSQINIRLPDNSWESNGQDVPMLTVLLYKIKMTTVVVVYWVRKEERSAQVYVVLMNWLALREAYIEKIVPLMFLPVPLLLLQILCHYYHQIRCGSYVSFYWFGQALRQQKFRGLISTAGKTSLLPLCLAQEPLLIRSLFSCETGRWFGFSFRVNGICPSRLVSLLFSGDCRLKVQQMKMEGLQAYLILTLIRVSSFFDLLVKLPIDQLVSMRRALFWSCYLLADPAYESRGARLGSTLRSFWPVLKRYNRLWKV